MIHQRDQPGRELGFCRPNFHLGHHRENSVPSDPPHILCFITLTDPAHPGRVVAYPMQASVTGGHRLPGELVADTIEAVRAMLPAGLTRREPTPYLPAGAVEMWDRINRCGIEQTYGDYMPAVVLPIELKDAVARPMLRAQGR